jgi:hypothetical protein
LTVQLTRQLIEHGLSQVARYAPDGDKIMRLQTVLFICRRRPVAR